MKIFFDTETTGFAKTDEIVELGAIREDGELLHYYFKPSIRVPQEAVAVHGLSNEALASAPTFDACLPGIIEFFRGHEVIAHNAPFDTRMMTQSFERHGAPDFRLMVNDVACTLAMAKKVIPKGEPTTLDALCKRYGVSLEGRDLHGALIDAQLLRQVYPKLIADFEALKGAPAAVSAPAIPATPEVTRLAQQYLKLELSAAPYEAKLKEIEKQKKELLKQVEALAKCPMNGEDFEVGFKSTLRMDWKGMVLKLLPAADKKPFESSSTALTITARPKS